MATKVYKQVQRLLFDSEDAKKINLDFNIFPTTESSIAQAKKTEKRD